MLLLLALTTHWFVNFVVIAARIREILEHVGLAQESLPSNVVSSTQVLANVANLLNIRDTELSRWAWFLLDFFVILSSVSLTFFRFEFLV